MPLAAPKDGETRDSFHSRCMGESGMVSEFPEKAQRNAVCYQQWRRKRKGDTVRQVLSVSRKGKS